MRRTRWGRSVSMLLVLWFTVATVDPPGLHVCPMHDMPAGAMAAMDGPAMQMSPSPHGRPDRAHGHQCTCLGACSASVAVAAPQGIVIAVRPLVAVRVERPTAAIGHRPSEPEHARPPSVGPPSLHIG